MKYSHLLQYILMLFLLLSCNDNNKTNPIEKINPERTILVYMGGKNNLSTETYEKLNALKEGWESTNKGYLIVYHAPIGEEPKLLEIYTDQNGDNTIRTIESYEKENSADPKVLNRIIQKTMTLYPADSYGLIVFSHATGWLPSGTQARSIIVDNNREMELIDFADAIPDNVFDFIILEACHMAGIEVAYQLKEKTEHILASSAEILSPGFTNIYREHISSLYEIHPDLENFTQNGFNYFNSKSGEECSATFSLIHTAPLTRLANFLKTYHIPDPDLNLEELQYFDRYASYKLFYDFKDYYIRQLDGSNKQELLSNLLNECVVYKTATSSFMPYSNGYEIKKHSGLTTYIPQEEFTYYNEKYKELDWYKDVFE